jgi:hypothetical protein
VPAVRRRRAGGRGRGDRPGAPVGIRAGNLADGGPPWRKVAEPAAQPGPHLSWSGLVFADNRVAPPARRPQQDSNLRTRLRSAGPKKALTSMDMAPRWFRGRVAGERGRRDRLATWSPGRSASIFGADCSRCPAAAEPSGGGLVSDGPGPGRDVNLAPPCLCTPVDAIHSWPSLSSSPFSSPFCL